MLSARQHAEFEERGLLRLAGWIDARAAGELRERVLERVRERKLAPDPQAGTWAVNPSRLASLTSQRTFESFWGARTTPLIDALLGAGRWRCPQDAGQILAMSFPRTDLDWSLPHTSWHLDYMAPSALAHLPGLQLFVCLDRIEPRGGATLVAGGVHRLVDALRRAQGHGWPGRSADVRGQLKASVPWLRELASPAPSEDREARFMRQATDFEGARLQVVELVGEPGDVYAMHPWLLHTLSPNCGTRPRLALTQRLHARSELSSQ